MEAAQLNREVAKRIIDHQIDLLRLAAGERKQILDQIDILSKKVRAELLMADTGSTQKLNRLLSAINELVQTLYGEIGDANEIMLNDYHALEQRAFSSIANAVIGSQAFQVSAAKFDGLMLGSPLGMWWARQAEDLKFKLGGIVRSGVIEGRTNEQLAREFNQVFEVSKTHARTLVNTSVATVTGHARKTLYERNADIMLGLYQLSTLDARTSEICRARDGLKWTLEYEPVGHNQAFRDTPLHPNCRSLMLPWIDDGTNSTRASAFGQVDAKLTYEEWLKDKPVEMQDDILGNGKAQMWRDGKITFLDMIDQTGRPLSLEQLNKKFTQPA